MQALFAARQREETDEFKDTYRHRAGIEGTHSQGVRTMRHLEKIEIFFYTMVLVMNGEANRSNFTRKKGCS
jgi:hypothetical protein